MTYLVLDLDNTVWNKQWLDNKAYRIVSKMVFGRIIPMLFHPITGERDHDFARHSNHEIWKYKIEQVLDSREELSVDGRISNIEQVDINDLVERLGPAAVGYLSFEPEAQEKIQINLPPEKLKELSDYVTTIGIASSGARELQEHLLSKLGYFNDELRNILDYRFCTFADEGRDKQSLIERSIEKYVKSYRQEPKVLVYVGDSEQDMFATKSLDRSHSTTFKAVGVLTGNSTRDELYGNGADLVLPSLDDTESLSEIKLFLLRLQDGI